MSYYDDDELATEDELSSDLVNLLQTAERFSSRPRRTPTGDPDAEEPIDWEAREEPAGDDD